jgi:dephospho-CoA kinase
MANQVPDEDWITWADAVVNNTGTPAALREAVLDAIGEAKG